MAIRITATRGTTLGSLPNIVTPVKIAFVGQSNGADLYKREKFINSTSYKDQSTYNRTEDYIKDGSVIESEVRAITRIALTADDEINTFREDYDYVLVSPNIIKWKDKAMGVPLLDYTPTNDATIADGTHLFRVLAKGFDDDVSVASNVIQFIKDTTTSTSVILKWDKVEFSQGYVVEHKLFNDSTYNIIKDTTTGNIVQLLISDTTAIFPDYSQGAVRKPKEYYIDYKTVTYDYSVNAFTSLREVLVNHGIGSDLTNMSRIAFNQYGIDEIYLCAVDGTNASAYTDAIDKISNIENIQYVVALTDIDNVHNYNVNQARINSGDIIMKERFAIVAKSNTETDIEDLVTWVESFNNEKRAICVVANGNKIYMDSWQNEDGSYTDNKLVGNQFLAGAYGCAVVTAPNVATSVINATVNGFNFGADAPPWVDNVEKNKFLNAGATYVMVKRTRPVFYNDNTNDTSITENFERSVMSAEDEIRRRLRASGERYIGKPIIDSLLGAIYSSTVDVLGIGVRDSIIRGFRNIEVSQDTLTPTKVNVTFLYTPIYPLLELVFNYGFDLGNTQ